MPFAVIFLDSPAIMLSLVIIVIGHLALILFDLYLLGEVAKTYTSFI